ncbi:hypothetical protein MTP99_012149 [Tenebrio molitor]|jgi:hypothetical protein|nr:hypothetical protein MTP99_012149 [Tenebrio molitor]
MGALFERAVPNNLQNKTSDLWVQTRGHHFTCISLGRIAIYEFASLDSSCLREADTGAKYKFPPTHTSLRLLFEEVPILLTFLFRAADLVTREKGETTETWK